MTIIGKAALLDADNKPLDSADIQEAGEFSKPLNAKKGQKIRFVYKTKGLEMHEEDLKFEQDTTVNTARRIA